MKTIAKLALAVVLLSSSSQAVVTLTSRNFSSATVGVPVVSATGVAVDQGTVFASAGVLAEGFVINASTTVAQILANFTPVTTTPVSLHATFDGLFNGAQSPDFGTDAAPNATFVGKTAFVLIGNSATLSSSSAVALFNAGVTFNSANSLGAGSQTLDATTAAKVVYGNVVPVTVQPSLNGAAFASGVVLIPEPSVALLGLLGCVGFFRRRR